MLQPWLKRYPPGVRQHLEYPEVPMYHLVYEQIKRLPDRTALLFYGRKISYRELGELADRFAAALINRFGMRKGDRLGIMLPNSPQNVIAILGAQRAGVIPVQFNPMYVEREIEHQVQDCGCSVLLTLDLFWPRVRAAGGVPHYLVTSVRDFLPFPLNLLYPLTAKLPKVAPGEAALWTDFMQESARAFVPVPLEPKEDPGVLIYTGGTTGVSKGVVLTHANLVANILQIKEWLQIPPDRHEKVLVLLPLFHSYGFTAALGLGLATGATCILVPKFEAEEVLKLIHKYRPTSFPGVPTVYTALLNHPKRAKYDLTSIEYCVSGAAPLAVELLHEFEGATRAAVVEGYGMTETSPVISSNPFRSGERKPGSVGLPYSDTEIRIVGLTTGADVEPGQEGEILVRGPQVMKGYWNRPAETAEMIREGWLRTGDIGRMDEDGYLYIVDRLKDLVLSGGFNVYPREIDEVLFQHPAVLEACSVGIPDPYRGESVKSFVVLKPGATATEQEILAHCRANLANYKRPVAVEFLPELPKSTIGKVLKRVLADRERARMAKEQVANGRENNG